MKNTILILLCFGFWACNKKDSVAPVIHMVSVNGSEDHWMLEAGVVNTIELHLEENNSLSQVKVSITKQGTYANHDHGDGTNFYGLWIPNHGDFESVSVRNLSGTSQAISIPIEIPLETSGLWKLTIQLLDEEGNVQNLEDDIMINSMAFPFLSITSMSSALTLGEGQIAAPSNTNWDWQGDVYDLDTLDYIRITIQQNGDTIDSYINEFPNTWTLDLATMPITMPTNVGNYQFRFEMGDILGHQTWRTSTLIVQ